MVARGATGRADAKLGWTGAATCLVCCATGQCDGGSGGLGASEGVRGLWIPLRWHQIERSAGGWIGPPSWMLYIRFCWANSFRFLPGHVPKTGKDTLGLGMPHDGALYVKLDWHRKYILLYVLLAIWLV